MEVSVWLTEQNMLQPTEYMGNIIVHNENAPFYQVVFFVFYFELQNQQFTTMLFMH